MIGRPGGSKNQPVHSAGGLRAKAGRKKLRIEDVNDELDELDPNPSMSVDDLPQDSGECFQPYVSFNSYTNLSCRPQWINDWLWTSRYTFANV
jgi:hypothetical protein